MSNNIDYWLDRQNYKFMLEECSKEELIEMLQDDSELIERYKYLLRLLNKRIKTVMDKKINNENYGVMVYGFSVQCLENENNDIWKEYVSMRRKNTFQSLYEKKDGDKLVTYNRNKKNE